MVDLVLSIEQCKHLQELGLDMSDAKLGFYKYPITFDINGNVLGEDVCIHGMDAMGRLGTSQNAIPTYTLQEILNKLPNIVEKEGFNKVIYTWKINSCAECIEYSSASRKLYIFNYSNSSILNALYDMLCWVIENEYLKVK